MLVCHAVAVFCLTRKRTEPSNVCRMRAASPQAMVRAVHQGAARGLGALVGGILHHHYGARAVFGMAALWASCGWALQTIAILLGW